MSVEYTKWGQRGYLQTEEDGYILQENGGRLVIQIFKEDREVVHGTFTKIAK